MEECCTQLSVEPITAHTQTLLPAVWQLLQRYRLWSLRIPAQWGGLGFSALALSEAVMKLASRNMSAAISWMSPNTLLPIELLVRYGSPTQQAQYLPAIAKGEQQACLLLDTQQLRDCTAITARGVVCTQLVNDTPTLVLRLAWQENFANLAPPANLLVLAFHLTDPDHLLTGCTTDGITLAIFTCEQIANQLVHERTWPPHNPLPLESCQGNDVFLPLDTIVGGTEKIGQGWPMLVTCLNTSRDIALPAIATGVTKVISRYCGAYAYLCQPFKPEASSVQHDELLARIAANTYLLNAGRLLTAAAIDQGQQPELISALIKSQAIRPLQQVLKDAWQLAEETGFCAAQQHYLIQFQLALPLSQILYGINAFAQAEEVFNQGLLRCHPHLTSTLQALQAQDQQALNTALRRFWRHSRHNLRRSWWYGLSNARFNAHGSPLTRGYYRRFIHLTGHFALLTDYSLLVLGKNFSRQVRLSRRLTDIVTNLYVGSALLKGFEEQGQPETDLPLVHYACTWLTYRIQQILLAVINDLPKHWSRTLLQRILFPYGAPFAPVQTELEQQVAQLMLEPCAARDRLTQGIYLTNNPQDSLGRVEDAWHKSLTAQLVEQQVTQLMTSGTIQADTLEDALAEAKSKHIVDKFSVERLLAARKAVLNALRIEQLPSNFYPKTQTTRQPS